MSEVHHQVITKIERQQRRPRYNVYINEEYKFSVHEDVVVKHRLLKGEMIDEDKISVLLRDEERQKVVQAALRYIGRRAHSVQEVHQKLYRAGYKDELINDVLSQLQEQGYLDDQDYANRRAEYCFHSQNRGRRWIEQDLRHKGIAPNQIQKAMQLLSEQDEFEHALELARKRWGRSRDEITQRKRKTAAYLMRRGFPNELVWKAINTVAAIDEDEDDIDNYDH